MCFIVARVLHCCSCALLSLVCFVIARKLCRCSSDWFVILLHSYRVIGNSYLHSRSHSRFLYIEFKRVKNSKPKWMPQPLVTKERPCLVQCARSPAMLHMHFNMPWMVVNSGSSANIVAPFADSRDDASRGLMCSVYIPVLALLLWVYNCYLEVK